MLLKPPSEKTQNPATSHLYSFHPGSSHAISHLNDERSTYLYPCFCPSSQLHPQSICNIATRVIIWKSTSDPISPQLNPLQWLLSQAEEESTRCSVLWTAPTRTQHCRLRLLQCPPGPHAPPSASMNKPKFSCPSYLSSTWEALFLEYALFSDGGLSLTLLHFLNAVLSARPSPPPI